jgi:hypothetical protein
MTSAEPAIYGKAWAVRDGGRVPKTVSALDRQAGTIRCPNAVTTPFQVGGVVRCPAAVCAACPLRARCTGRPQGRRVSIYPDEALGRELRERQQSPEGGRNGGNAWQANRHRPIGAAGKAAVPAIGICASTCATCRRHPQSTCPRS